MFWGSQTHVRAFQEPLPFDLSVSRMTGCLTAGSLASVFFARVARLSCSPSGETKPRGLQEKRKLAGLHGQLVERHKTHQGVPSGPAVCVAAAPQTRHLLEESSKIFVAVAPE